MRRASSQVTERLDVMNNRATSKIAGTKTEQSLKNAVQNEALSFAKYMLYSERAKQNDEHNMSKVLKELAQSELAHYELWLGYLDEYPSLDRFLDDSIDQEIFAGTYFYPDASKVAESEGFSELANKFEMTGNIEHDHANTLNELSALMSDDYLRDDPMTIWKCNNCGHTTKGNTPPDVCPLCSYGKKHFFIQK